mmetsp:Transcript_77990/g.246374  ORF Transcript_77990/g.246374 Transcript_77990/m.246374 type:complete len:224 (-) Transcript_77990:274-945(-)
MEDLLPARPQESRHRTLLQGEMPLPKARGRPLRALVARPGALEYKELPVWIIQPSFIHPLGHSLKVWKRGLLQQEFAQVLRSCQAAPSHDFLDTIEDWAPNAAIDMRGHSVQHGERVHGGLYVVPQLRYAEVPCTQGILEVPNPDGKLLEQVPDRSAERMVHGAILVLPLDLDKVLHGSVLLEQRDQLPQKLNVRRVCTRRCLDLESHLGRRGPAALRRERRR